MASPVIQQTKAPVTAFAATVSNSFSSTPTVGRHVVALGVFEFGDGARSLTCSDNQGNTYTQRVFANIGAGNNSNRQCAYFTAPIVTASGTFTVTFSRDGGGSDNIELVLYEVSGAGLTTVPTASLTNNATTRTSWTLDFPALTGDAVMLACIVPDTAGVSTDPANWANESLAGHYTGRIVTYKRTTWTGSGDGDVTFTTTNNVGGPAVGIALYDSAGSAGGIPKTTRLTLMGIG